MIFNMDWITLLRDYYPHTHHDKIAFIPTTYSGRAIGQTIVAMANGDGGMVCVGIDQHNFHLHGAAHDEQWITQLIHTQCDPVPTISIESIIRNDKTLIIVHVPSGDAKPYRFRHTCFVRRNGLSQSTTSEEEYRLKEDNLSARPMSAEYTAPTVDDMPLNTVASCPSDTEVSRLNSRQEKALEYVATHGFITNKLFREMSHVSHKTAHLELVDLVHKKRLITDGSGRSTRYIRTQPVPSQGDNRAINHELFDITPVLNSRPTQDNAPPPNTEQNKKNLITSYLKQHNFISEQDYATLCRIPISIAVRELNHLIVDGTLLQVPHNGTMYYQLHKKASVSDGSASASFF